MEIKELEKVEIPSVVELFCDVRLNQEKNEEGEKFEKEINEAFGKDHLLIAKEDENTIGFSWSKIYVDMEGNKVDKMIMVIIPTKRYGEGIGGALIEKERAYAQEKGIDIFDIEVGKL